MLSRGIEKKQIREFLENFFNEKASRYSLDLAFLYGSRAIGLPRRDSDVDIAVHFLETFLSEEDSFTRICDLSLRLIEGLDLDVNVIQIRESFDRPMLYYNAIVLGIPVYVKDHEKYIRIKNEAIYQMEDYSIFGLGWQNEITRKNLESLRNARVSIRQR